jgi:lambda family phage portal protein
MTAPQLFDAFNRPVAAASNGPVLRDTSYAGASLVPKELSSWMPPLQPADADLLPDLAMLTARSRDLTRNHGIAASGIRTLTDNIVGYTLRLSAWPDYVALGKTKEWADNWARQTESVWRTWSNSTSCDSCGLQTLAGLTTLTFRSALLNGDAIALALWQPKRTGFATTIQLVESDRLANPDWRQVNSRIRGGIETDAQGRPIAYYIRRNSSFYIDSWGMTDVYGYTNDYERVPATTSWGRRRVIHVFEPDRVGQTRGEPLYAPLLEQFKMFDHYQRVELQSAIVNGLVAAIIQTPMDPAALAELMGGDPEGYLSRKNEYRTYLRGGAVIPLFPGDQMQPFAPARPASQYPEFVTTVLRHIASGLNIPYELLVKDFSQTTYASARASIEEARRMFLARRASFAQKWMQPIYELWLEEAVDKGLVDAPDFYNKRAYYQRAKWIGPGRSAIDPLKEVEAANRRIATGLSTLEVECAEYGLDWQDVQEQRATEIARQRALGLWEDNLQLQAPGKEFGGDGGVTNAAEER